jgi:glycosyltransferase involved in cell wall biosynthesis
MHLPERREPAIGGREVAPDAEEVAVIIPVFDHRELLPKCIAALRNQDYPLRAVRIVIVDNGGSDGAAARLESLQQLLAAFPNAGALHEPKRGSYSARNAAIRATSAPILAFTDADCVPDPSWLSVGLDWLRNHENVAAVAGAIELVAADPKHRSGAELYEIMHEFDQERFVHILHFGATANLFVRRTSFEQVGMFDQTLQSGGDAEWGRRLYLNGLEMQYVSGALVRHPARPSLNAVRLKLARVTAGVAQIRAKESRSKADHMRYVLRPAVPPIKAMRRASKDARLHTRAEVLRYAIALLMIRGCTFWYRFQQAVRQVSRTRPQRS